MKQPRWLWLSSIAISISACTCTPSRSVSGASGAGGAISVSNSGATGAPSSSSSSGSASGVGGAGGDSWLSRPDLWEPVGGPLEQKCEVMQAKLPAEGIPQRAWTACGAGCRETSVVLPDSGMVEAYYFGIRAKTYKGEIIYRVSGDAGDLSKISLTEVRRLADDGPVILLRHRKCLPLAGAFSSPLFFGFGDATDPNLSTISAGRGLMTSPAKVIFADQGIPLGDGAVGFYEVDPGWAAVWDGVELDINENPASSTVTNVYTSSLMSVSGQSDGLLTWADWTGWSPPAKHANLFLWSKSTGPIQLVPGVNDVADSAITDDRIVWIESTGFASRDGKWETSQLFYTQRTTDPSAVQRHDGPMIPHGSVAVNGLVAYGDYAAVVVGDDTGMGVVVANLVTSQTWFIPNRPGKVFYYVLAMNASEILVVEYNLGHSNQLMDTLVRLDLTKLDDLAKGWGP